MPKTDEHKFTLPDGKISPSKGYSGTYVFTFSITYTSQYNKEPDKMELVINSTVFPMFKYDLFD